MVFIVSKVFVSLRNTHTHSIDDNEWVQKISNEENDQQRKKKQNETEKEVTSNNNNNSNVKCGRRKNRTVK